MVFQNLLPAFLPFIRKQLPRVEPALITFLQKYPPLPGEKGVTAILDIDGEKAFVAIVGIDANNTVVRVLARARVSKFIENMMHAAGKDSPET
ncbi:MAG: hypothetical protein LBI89_03955 [Prevotellaceae bacterium]|jgi:hypothetical protein|nr:hypothetical protein [Prevotellaceae bacterium]